MRTTFALVACLLTSTDARAQSSQLLPGERATAVTAIPGVIVAADAKWE